VWGLKYHHNLPSFLEFITSQLEQQLHQLTERLRLLLQLDKLFWSLALLLSCSWLSYSCGVDGFVPELSCSCGFFLKLM
jgi:hypothetical protein